jgi:hypothetical protein
VPVHAPTVIGTQLKPVPTQVWADTVSVESRPKKLKQRKNPSTGSRSPFFIRKIIGLGD